MWPPRSHSRRYLFVLSRDSPMPTPKLLLSGVHLYLCGICGSLPLCELEQRLCETNGWVRESEVLHLFAGLAHPLTNLRRHADETRSPPVIGATLPYARQLR